VSELETAARLVARQAQVDDELLLHPGERRFVLHAAFAVEQLVRNARRLEHFDVLRCAVELLLRAKKLQRALHALVIKQPFKPRQ
jgi:hypothetical protein